LQGTSGQVSNSKYQHAGYKFLTVMPCYSFLSLE
jgi:hypothetical protein